MDGKNGFNLKLFLALWVVLLLLFELSFKTTLGFSIFFGLVASTVLTFLVWKYRKPIFDETGPSKKIFAGMAIFYVLLDVAYRGFGDGSLAATITTFLILGIIWGGITAAVVWNLAKKK